MHARTHTHSHCRSNRCVIFAFITASVRHVGMWASVLSCCRGSGWPHPDPHREPRSDASAPRGAECGQMFCFCFFCCFFLRARSLPAFSATRMTKHLDQNSNGINQRMTMLTCCCCVSECVFFVVCWVRLPSTPQAGKSQQV